MISMILRRIIIILIYLVLDLNYQLCDSKYLSEFKDINSNFFSGDKNSQYSYELSCNKECEESILKRAINSRMLTEEEQKLQFKNSRWTPSPILPSTASQRVANKDYKKTGVQYTHEDDYEFFPHKKRNCKRNNKLNGLRRRRYSQDFHTNVRGKRAHKNKNQFRVNRKRKHIFNNLKKLNASIITNELSTLYKNVNNVSEVNIKNNPLYQAQILQEPCNEVNTNYVSSIISDCFNNKRQVTSQVTHRHIKTNGQAAKTKLNSSIVNTNKNTSNISSKCKSNVLPSDDFDTLQSFLQMYRSNNIFNGNCACQKNGNPIMFGYTASPMTIKRLQNFTHYPFYHQKYIEMLLKDNKLISNTSRSAYNFSYSLPDGGSKNEDHEFSKFTDERSIFETQTINLLDHDDLALIEPVLSLADTSSYPKNFTLVLALVPYPDTSTITVSSRSTTTTMEPLKYLYAGKTTKKPKLDTTESNMKKQEASSAITIIVPATIISPIRLPVTTPCPAPTLPAPALPAPALPAPVTIPPAPVTPATVAPTATPPAPAPTPCTTAAHTPKPILFQGELIAAAPKSKMLRIATDIFGDVTTIVNELMPITHSVSRDQGTDYGDQQTALDSGSFTECLSTHYPCTKYIYMEAN